MFKYILNIFLFFLLIIISLSYLKLFIMISKGVCINLIEYLDLINFENSHDFCFLFVFSLLHPVKLIFV